MLSQIDWPLEFVIEESEINKKSKRLTQRNNKKVQSLIVEGTI